MITFLSSDALCIAIAMICRPHYFLFSFLIFRVVFFPRISLHVVFYTYPLPIVVVFFISCYTASSAFPNHIDVYNSIWPRWTQFSSFIYA